MNVRKTVASMVAGLMLSSGLVIAGGVSNPAAAASVAKVGTPEVVEYGNRSFAIKWTPPKGATRQEVTLQKHGGGTIVDRAKVGMSTRYSFGGLEGGTTYCAKVRGAITGTSTYGAWSEWRCFKVGLPGQVGVPLATPGNAQVGLWWPASTYEKANYYIVRWYAGTSTTALKSTTTTSNSYTATGLANGTTYRFSVQPVGTYGTGWDSPKSAAAIPKTVPLTPTNVKVTAASKQVSVTWTAPGNGGSAITGYNVQIQRQGDLGWSDIRQSTATNLVWTGLKNGQTVNVRVQARNANGAGTFGYADPATPVGPPEQVTQPVATGATAAAEAVWVAPDNGGKEITGYDVRYRYIDDPQDAYRSAPSVNGETLKTKLTGLTTGLWVGFQIRAKNELGEGEWSSLSEYVEVLREPASAPIDVKATAGKNSITVSWLPGPPNGTAIKGFEARVSCDGGKNWITKVLPVNQYAHTFTGLPGGKTCTTQVRTLATDPDDPNSAWVDVSKQVAPIPQPAPGIPSASSLKWANTKTVSVRIAAPSNARSMQVRTASGSSSVFGAWKTISKSTKSLKYSPGSTGITVQVRACTELCSAPITISMKYSARSTKAAKKLTQVAGVITRGNGQTVYFQNRKTGAWRVSAGTRAAGKWRNGAPSTYSTSRAGLTFQLRTKDKKALGTFKVLKNGTFSGVVKGR